MSFNLIWNRTASLPVGLWRKVGPFKLTPEARGRYVIFCPPDNMAMQVATKRHVVGRGHCPGGHIQLIKEVVGLPGDLVEVAGEVFVNHRQVTNGGLNTDFAKLCRLDLPVHVTLGGANLWLMSSYAEGSFDSRYFGPIEAASVEAFVEPLLTF